MPTQFKLPLSTGTDGKTTSTHVSVNPYLLTILTADEPLTGYTYDGHEAVVVDTTIAAQLGNSNVGGVNTPIYLDGGIPKACTIDLSKYVLKTGDTMTGTLTLHGVKGTIDIDYGETLPTTDNSEGRIFFQIDPTQEYELPAGGTTGLALLKNSNSDRDVKWGVVSIAGGGTGKTTAAEAWTALGGGDSGKHADNYFVRQIATTNDNIDSDWGVSFKTFDPVPSGTPPESNPNISVINIGENFNRRKQLAFTYSNNNIYYRRRLDGTWQTWVKLLHSGNYTDYTVTKTGGGASGTWGISISGNAATASSANSVAWGNVTGKPSTFAPSSHSHSEYVTKNTTWTDDMNNCTVSGFYRINNTGANRPSDWGQMLVCHGNGDTIFQMYVHYSDANVYVRAGNPSQVGGSGSWTAWKRLWRVGDAVTNAVWNDLAECRKSFVHKPGYVITPAGTLTTKRLEPGCRITSDTWGFALGNETDKDKMPVAISGRVLAYPYRPKKEYNLGDCVCSAPGGKVDIMTRDEIKEWPDCILGIVNEIPDYDEWGSDEKDNTGRGKIKVYDRIWIDIK